MKKYFVISMLCLAASAQLLASPAQDELNRLRKENAELKSEKDKRDAKDRQKSVDDYFKTLKERQNIPQTKEQWEKLQDKARALGKAKGDDYSELEKVKKLGYKDQSWAKANPGKADLVYVTSIVTIIGLLVLHFRS